MPHGAGAARPAVRCPCPGQGGSRRSPKVLLDELKFFSLVGRFSPAPHEPSGSPIPGVALPGRRARGHQRALRARASWSSPRAPGLRGARSGSGHAAGPAASGSSR